MSIESKATEHENGGNYPKLMVSSIDDGLIVLFRSAHCGTVVADAKPERIGLYKVIWTMSDFTEYHGTVTLSNK